MPQSPPDWYDDPDGSGGQRWWDGLAWTAQCRKRPPSNTAPSPQFEGSQTPEQWPHGGSSGQYAPSGYGPPRSLIGRLRIDPDFRKKAVLTGSGLAIVMIIAVGLVSWWADRRGEQRLWSLLPHTIGCTPELYAPFPNPPGPVKAQHVELEHLDGRRIAVSVTFSEPPPPEPVPVRTTYGELRDPPGSLSYWISVDDTQSDASVVVYSPTDGDSWRAVMISSEAILNWEERPEIPLEVSTSGNVLRLVLDLPSHTELLNHPPFAPQIGIQSQVAKRVELLHSEEIGALLKYQQCDWTTPVATTPGPVTRDQAGQPQPSTPAPTTVAPPSSSAASAPSPNEGITAYVRTKSGQVRCAVSAASVVCERNSIDGFPQAPASTTGGEKWNLAAVDGSGAFNWSEGNIGGPDPAGDLVLEYGDTHRLRGWTVDASSDGTRFTNIATGKGMFVSIENVYAF